MTPTHQPAPPAADTPDADRALLAGAADPTTPPRPPSRWLLLGVLLGAVLLTALLTGGIAWQRGSFATHGELYAVVDNAAGLAPGTAVRMSGVRVGEVRALDLQPDLTVRVVLRIDATLMQRLRLDAAAVLVREQLRPPVIELDAGRASAALNPDDPRISFRGRNTLTEIADDLRSRLVPILDDLKQVTGTLRQRQGDIAAVVAHAASASGELAGASAEMRALTVLARGQLGALGGQTQGLLAQGQGLLAQGQQSVGKVNVLIEQVNTGLGLVNSSLGVVNTTLPSLLGKADTTLAHLNAVAQDGRQIASAAAATLPGVLRAVPPVVDDAQDLVQGLRRNWVVRSLLPPAPQPELPVQSHDAAALRDATPR